MIIKSGIDVPIGFEKTYYKWTEKSFFYFDRSCEKTFKDMKLSDAFISKLTASKGEGIWEFNAVSVNEQHVESAGITNVVADTYACFTTGASPLQVTIEGFINLTQLDDHRTDFLYMYDAFLRGSSVSKHNLLLNYLYRDTVMRLKISNFSMMFNDNSEDFIQTSIVGVGSKYSVLDATLFDSFMYRDLQIKTAPVTQITSNTGTTNNIHSVTTNTTVTKVV